MIDTKEIRKALAIHGVDVLNEDEVLDVLDHLEAAEKSDAESIAMYRKARDERDTLRTHLSFAKDELNRLRAVLEAMEQQEPIAYQCKVPDGWPTEEMTTAFARVFNSRDQYGTFPQAFRAALAAAPEAKL